MNKELREKAIAILKDRGNINQDLYTNNLEELIEELNIYHIELEQQNEELLLTQRRLEDSEHSYKELFDNAPVGYLLINEDYEVLTVNKTACKLLSVDYQSIIYNTFVKFIHPDYQDQFYFYLKNLFNGAKHSSLDLKLKKGLNSFFYARINSLLDKKDPGQKTIKLTVTDISREKEMEIKLQSEKNKAIESEQRWQFALDSTESGLYDYNLEKNEIFYSLKWQELYNQNKEMETLTLDNWIARIVDEHRTEVEKEYKKLLNGENSYLDLEYRIYDKIKSTRWIWDKAKVISKDNNDQPVRIIGTQTDITDRKENEQIIIQNNRLNAISQLVSGMAHEFNNELQSILGLAELSLEEEDEDSIEENLSNIIKISHSSSKSVKKLLRFTGQRTEIAELEVVEVAEVISNSTKYSESVRKQLTATYNSHIELEIEGTEQLKVHGNYLELTSALNDLIKNSFEAMPLGGKILIKYFKQNDSAVIQVIDNGTGMDTESRMKAFEPFFTTKGLELGKGMGLSIVKAIISDHKGKIEIIKSDKNGTTIEIKLPLAKPINLPFVESISPNLADGEINLLWVDDEEMIRGMAKRYLEKFKVNGKVVSSADEALESLDKEKFDLVITDIGMEPVNGWILAEKIYKIYGSKIKIVALTGWGDSFPYEKNRRYVWKVLGKPIQVKEFKKLLDEFKGV